MNRNAPDGSWLDEYEPGVRPCLQCDVEINIEGETTYRTIVADAAAALRTLALQLEEGKLDDGHHPLRNLKGEEIGTVYLDFSGEIE